MANIFLLEDDKILSKGISIALKKDEHTVTAVYGYLEALQQYQKQKYDLFLLDINLPDGSGLALCEKIRETSETPVLFLTANDTEEDMLSGFSAGCFPALLYHYHKNKRKYLLNNWPYYTIQKITTETAGGQTTREQGRRFQKKYEKHEMQPAVA